jgi:hypothetical protein
MVGRLRSITGILPCGGWTVKRTGGGGSSRVFSRGSRGINVTVRGSPRRALNERHCLGGANGSRAFRGVKGEGRAFRGVKGEGRTFMSALRGRSGSLRATEGHFML